MAKYIPLSIVLMTLIMPIAMSRRPGPKRSVRMLQGLMAGFILLWAYLCLNVYTQYVFIE
jgi:hypothetical protein